MGAVGIDHMNPKSWTGDVSVAKVSLQVCWEEGRTQATALISSIYPEDSPFNFNKAFSHPHQDLLQPKGKYIGVLNEVDSSLDDDMPGQVSHNAGTLPFPWKLQNTDTIADKIGEPSADESAEEQDHSEDEVDSEGSCDDEDSVDLEDLLPNSAEEPLNSFSAKPEEWLEVDSQ